MKVRKIGLVESDIYNTHRIKRMLRAFAQIESTPFGFAGEYTSGIAAIEFQSIANKALNDFYKELQIQSREIGEGDFCDCTIDDYIYCEKSPEHDVRVIEK